MVIQLWKWNIMNGRAQRHIKWIVYPIYASSFFLNATYVVTIDTITIRLAHTHTVMNIHIQSKSYGVCVCISHMVYIAKSDFLHFMPFSTRAADISSVLTIKDL